MKRREFLKTSVAASAISGLSLAGFKAAAQPKAGGNPEFYELRAYHTKPGPGREMVEEYLAKALIPTLNRLGSKPVGVFAQQERPGNPDREEVREPDVIFALIPYQSLDAFGATTLQIASDEEHHKLAGHYWRTPKSAPAFDRIMNSLMRAFTGMPHVELASYSKEKRPRMFEIRYYQSHNEEKALKKIQMFNSGEIEVMREVGLAPVFYGQVLVGREMPHLTYMLSAESVEAHKKHWEAFGKHPVWNKIKNDPEYADTVSNISKRFLVPTPYSQI